MESPYLYSNDYLTSKDNAIYKLIIKNMTGFEDQPLSPSLVFNGYKMIKWSAIKQSILIPVDTSNIYYLLDFKKIKHTPDRISIATHRADKFSYITQTDDLHLFSAIVQGKITFRASGKLYIVALHKDQE